MSGCTAPGGRAFPAWRECTTAARTRWTITASGRGPDRSPACRAGSVAPQPVAEVVAGLDRRSGDRFGGVDAGQVEDGDPVLRQQPQTPDHDDAGHDGVDEQRRVGAQVVEEQDRRQDLGGSEEHDESDERAVGHAGRHRRAEGCPPGHDGHGRDPQAEQVEAVSGQRFGEGRTADRGDVAGAVQRDVELAVDDAEHHEAEHRDRCHADDAGRDGDAGVDGQQHHHADVEHDVGARSHQRRDGASDEADGDHQRGRSRTRRDPRDDRPQRQLRRQPDHEAHGREHEREGHLDVRAREHRAPERLVAIAAEKHHGDEAGERGGEDVRDRTHRDLASADEDRRRRAAHAHGLDAQREGAGDVGRDLEQLREHREGDGAAALGRRTGHEGPEDHGHRRHPVVGDPTPVPCNGDVHEPGDGDRHRHADGGAGPAGGAPPSRRSARAGDLRDGSGIEDGT